MLTSLKFICQDKKYFIKKKHEKIKKKKFASKTRSKESYEK